jgi:hypothetical protein
MPLGSQPTESDPAPRLGALDRFRANGRLPVSNQA